MKTSHKKNHKYKTIISLLAVLLLSLFTAQALQVSVNNYDPQPAEAGKAVNVWFKVDNPTEDFENDVYIKIIPKDGLELTSGEDDTQFLGVMGARSSQVVQFRLFVKKDAFKGSHAIEATVSRGASFTNAAKTDLLIEVVDKDFKEVDLQIGDLESDPTRIKPDDDNVKLTVTLQNIGDGKAQNVKAEIMDLPEGITFTESYSGSELLGNIEADSTADAVFYIDVDEKVQPVEHEAGLKVSYKYKPDEEEDDLLYEEQTIPLNIAIKPIALYDITKVEVNPEEITAGDKAVIITLTLKNIGEEEGESVRIKAYGKTEQPFSFDKSSDFIAPSLKPGEEGQGTLEIKVNDDANLQKYFVDFEIKNVVNDDIITFDKKFPIEVKHPKPNNPWTLVGAALVVLSVVLVYILYRRIRKSRQKPVAKKTLGKKYGQSYLEDKK